MSQSQLEWYIAENQRLTQQVEQLVRDNHRLSASNKDLRKQLNTLSTSYAVGERGDACMSIDGGNL
jgi:regulator of replication initiation timing